MVKKIDKVFDEVETTFTLKDMFNNIDATFSIINTDLDIVKRHINDMEKELKFQMRLQWAIYIFVIIAILKIIFLK